MKGAVVVFAKCDNCKFLRDRIFTGDLRLCEKGHVSPFQDCENFEKQITLIDWIKKLFFNFIMIFQDADQLNKNPEWIKFLKGVKE